MSGIENITATPTSVTSDDVMRQNAINFRPLGITIGLWSISVGSVGNLLTILTFVANKKLRTTFNIILVNLAIIDFLTATLMLPFNIAGYVQMQWPFGNDSFTSRLQAFSYFCCGYSSVVFLIAITVNRLVGVAFPAKYNIWFSAGRMKWILIFCNLCAPVFLLPFLVGTDPDCSNANGWLTGYNNNQFLCTFVCLVNESSWHAYSQVIRVLFQFIPLVAMIIMYLIIFSVVHTKSRRLTMRMGPLGDVSWQATSGTSQNTTVRKRVTDRRSSLPERRDRQDSRILVISAAIFVGFTITFLPSVIVNLLPNRNKIDIRWHMAASNLTWLNSSLNPIIYVFLNRRFRREYWRIILIAFGSLKEKFIHDSSTSVRHNEKNTMCKNVKSQAYDSDLNMHQIHSVREERRRISSSV